jgi:hypothetical protein
MIQLFMYLNPDLQLLLVSTLAYPNLLGTEKAMLLLLLLRAPKND